MHPTMQVLSVDPFAQIMSAQMKSPKRKRENMGEGLFPPSVFGKPAQRSDRYISRPNDEGALREDLRVRAVPAGVLKLVPVRATR
jgi:hypothetical protein